MNKKQKPVFQHGKASFDQKYYQRFFSKYSKSEFKKYVNWADGWIRFLDRYVDIKNGKNRTLLEIGASMGYFSRIFKDRGFNVYGSDISSYIVEKARSIQNDIQFFELDIEKHIKKDKKFDYIVAFEVLEHLEYPKKALKNIFKMLKDNGTLVFSTPFLNKRSLSDPTHINVHDEKWWLDLGEKVGFKKKKVIFVTFIPYLYRISKYFSIGFPIKLDIPFFNCTCFMIFKK